MCWKENLFFLALFSIPRIFTFFIFNADPTRIHHLVYGGLWANFLRLGLPSNHLLEMVYRRIEYFIEGDWNAQKKLNEAPWTTEKLLKKPSNNFCFLPLLFLFPIYFELHHRL